MAWLTGGAVELRVLTPCETVWHRCWSPPKGKRYYFTTENEAPRLHDEEFGALDFEPVIFPGMPTKPLQPPRSSPADRSAPTPAAPARLSVNLVSAARIAERN